MNHSTEEIVPYIHEVGLQKRDSWKNLYRRIYDHQFLYCFCGIIHIQIEERNYEVKQGDLVIIKPNVPHKLWLDEDVQGELYWFHCDLFPYQDKKWHYTFYNTIETYVTLFGNELQYKEHIRIDPVFENDIRFPEYMTMKDQETTEYLFRKMYKAYTYEQKNWQLLVRGYCYELLYSILRQMGDTKKRDLSKVYEVNRMKSYIAKNYYKPISVQEICNVTGFNVDYASRFFYKMTGKKLKEYLNGYRVEQAKKLMIDRDLKFADIAEMVGFKNENYFSTIIKRYEGKTPAKLRESLIELLLLDDK